MKAPDYETRWNNTSRQPYGEYLSAQPPPRKDSAGSVSQSRVTSRLPPRIPQQEPSLRKMPSDSGRKELPMNNAEQTKIISALKSELSNLKFEVTKLISNDRDVATAHTTMGGHDSLYAVKQNGRSVEPLQFDGRQSLTIHTHVAPQHHQYVNTHASTVQRKPSLQSDHDARETTLKQIDSLQLKEELRNSQMRERKATEERDDLARRLQQRSREFDQLKLATDNRSERYASSKDATERSLNGIIDQLRKQQTEAERYYVKRIQQLESSCRDMEGRLNSKEQETHMLRQDINNLTVRMKEEESASVANNSRYPKLIEQLQDSNRTLTKEITDLSERIRQEQERVYTTESKLAAAEMRAAASEQKATAAEHRAHERLSMQDQTRLALESDKRRLLDEIAQLLHNNNRLTEEANKLKDEKEERHREKSREIDALVAEKNRLAAARDDLMRQLEKQKEILAANSIPATPINNHTSYNHLQEPPVITLQVPTSDPVPTGGKSEMSKSSIIVLNSGNSITSQQSMTEQLKRQEIESLIARIDQLKKQKRAIEHDIKGLLETKQAIEQSLRNMPQSKTVDELRNELAQKDQVVNNLCNDVKNLQAEVAKNARIEKKLKSNEALLREANEFIIRTELAVLNKKYVA